MSKHVYLSSEQIQRKKSLRNQLAVHKVVPVRALPPSVDLRSKFPECYDQSDLGSCTANAIAGNLQYLGFENPSRLFIYYNELAVEDVSGAPIADTGADAADGCTNLEKIGVCPEEDWPYDITKFNQKPPQNAYDDSLKHKINSFQRVLRSFNYINNLKSLLVQGHPILTSGTQSCS